jgi:hypothetical protein
MDILRLRTKMNITVKDLDLAIKNLNEYSESGTFFLDKDCSGYLLMVETEFKIQRKISTVRMSKHDIYYLIGAVENALREENRIRNLREQE